MAARSSYIHRVFETLLSTEAYSVTLFMSDKEVVRATRRLYGRGKKRRFSKSAIEVAVTIGRPNFAERRDIARFRKDRKGRSVSGFSKIKYPFSKIKYPPTRKKA